MASVFRRFSTDLIESFDSNDDDSFLFITDIRGHNLKSIADDFFEAAVGPSPQTLSPVGIGSLESFGTPTLIPEQFLTCVSIGSLEAFGVPKISQQIRAVGIAGIELFGSVKLNLMLALFGVGSLELFGNPALSAPSGGGLSHEGKIAIAIAIRIGILLLCFL